MNAHREPAFEGAAWRGDVLEKSEEARERCIILPLHHEMTDDDQRRVAEALSASLAER